MTSAALRNDETSGLMAECWSSESARWTLGACISEQIRRVKRKDSFHRRADLRLRLSPIIFSSSDRPSTGREGVGEAAAGG